MGSAKSMIRSWVRAHHEPVAHPVEPVRARHRLADQRQIGVGAHGPIIVGDDHVRHVGILHGVLDQDVEREVVVREERALGPGSEVLGDGQAALGHLGAERLLGLAEQEGAHGHDGEDDQRSDQERELELQRDADPSPPSASDIGLHDGS
jgi:hypothetical protein